MTVRSTDMRARGTARGGFALLITITLVAFLVLVLVALATLTRVETRVADNSRDQAMARQHALFALNLAIGQLQEYTGPDQRVTTTADILADTDKAGTATPATVSTTARIGVQPGTRQWTAVWGNSQTGIGYNLKPDKIIGRGVTPALLNWLISGNEGTTYGANGTAGGVTAGTGMRYSPASVVDLTNLSAPTIDNKSAVLLVGPNSVGTAATATQDYIVAPLIPITAPAESLPGTSPNVGNYAWWVGDEGVKARINLQNGYEKTGLATDRIHSFITTQRSAIELMDRGDANPISMDCELPSLHAAKLFSKEQLALLGDDSAKKNNLSGAIRARFHDMTAFSRGVLSDTYAGGLKKDLTADIADTSADHSYRPTDSTPIFTPMSTTEPNLPTWGHLRSWARAVDQTSKQIIPQPANTTTAGIAPVLVYAAVGFEAYVDTSDINGDSVDDNTMRMAIYPVVMLSNPYPVTIAATRYDFGMRFQAQSYCALKSTKNLTIKNGNADNTTIWKLHALLDLGSLDKADAFLPIGTSTESAVKATMTRSDYLSFTIDCQPIPPGETHVYRLDGSVDRTNYAPGKLLTRAPAGAGAALGISNALILPGSYTLPASVLDSDVLMLHLRNISANMAQTRQNMEVVLAEEGGLTDDSRKYQHHTILAVSTGAGHAENYLVHNLSTSATMDSWKAGGFTQAAAAFRFGFPMETYIEWMSGIFGMGQIHNLVWLRHGNFRAPVGLSTRYESDATFIGGNPDHSTYSGTMIAGAVATNKSPNGDPALIFKTVGYATSMGGKTSLNVYGAAFTHILDAPAGELLNRTIFFDVLNSPDDLLSLGQLQHVPFSRYIFDPLNPFGNSMGDIRVPRTSNYNNRENIIPLDPNSLASTTYQPAYDLSWHLNHSLWDKYFVSGVPTSWTQNDIDTSRALPDSRMRPYKKDGDAVAIEDLRRTVSGTNPAYDRAAANLMVDGAFNINSTSEQAWRAILGGPLGLTTDDSFASTTDKVSQIIPYARFARGLKFPGDSTWAALDTTMNVDVSSELNYRKTNYVGNRGLWLNTAGSNFDKVFNKTIQNTNTNTNALINELAHRIVLEIRRNGPFLSLSDFVNRPILATENPAGIKGPLQTAIDTMSPLAAQANPRPQADIGLGTSAGAGDHLTYDANRMPATIERFKKWDWEHYFGGPLDVTASQMQQGTMPTRYTGETGTDSFRYVNAFGPKYLTQADILSTLGPELSARSDTFVIRTYGESLNPTTSEVEGRAWCEAIVQRTPDYIGGEAAETAPTALPADSLSSKFGRTFKVVSFRWLTDQDI